MRTRGQVTDWKQANRMWAKMSNAELAKLLGATYSTVAAMRRSLVNGAIAEGKPTTPFVHVRKSKVTITSRGAE